VFSVKTDNNLLSREMKQTPETRKISVEASSNDSSAPVRILFWNVNNKDLTREVCALADATVADIVILNENAIPSTSTLRALRTSVSADFHLPNSLSEKRFHCFCRNPKLDMEEIHLGNRISVRNLWLGKNKTLLVLLHGLDMRNHDDAARQSFAQSVATEIGFVKGDKGTGKVLVLGDFNMNPYDRGMNIPAGLNAMMTRACTVRGCRHYTGEDYDFYYNPMWGLFGDNTQGPAGTVYDTSDQGPYGWNMVDQIVVHHSLVPLFKDVKILTQAGETSLMTKSGRPDTNSVSDHFPILASFNGGVS